MLEENPTEDLGLEYSSDLLYHSPPSAGEGHPMLIPIRTLEVHPSASEAEVLTGAPMEGEEGTSAES